MAAVPRLTYFDGRGLAERIRFMLAAAGVEYTERVLTRELFLELVNSGVLMYNQVPLLEWTDGRVFVQSMATVRFLARTYGFYGDNDAEAALIDQVADGIVDFVRVVISFPFTKDMAALDAGVTKYFPCFEAILSKNAPSQFLVGTKLSYADVLLTEAIAGVLELRELDASAFPLCLAHHAAVTSSAWFVAFLASGHRHKLGDDVYARHVDQVLGR
eukprot:a512783_38.p2 GENE.a512783_38~~a512783_38.p2  ORF type:complete len:227 (+),score=96.20 a512783_38:36-683(+)